MNSHSPAPRPHTLSILSLATLALVGASASHAQGVATDAQLAPVLLTGVALRSGLAANLPSSSASKTAEELRDQNLFNPEDALKYMPNTSIRKRYIGDRNAMIGGRSFGTLQPGRGLAYVDGYLISNFLGRFDGPRWHMVTPEAIARVDMLYGPFSAIYPGNSIGSTVAITEREPRAFEASTRLTGYSQSFSQYGQDGRFNGGQLSAYVGNRLESGAWYTATLNHQDSTSQPMNYYTAGVNAKTGKFDPAKPGDKLVSGIQYDLDPKGQPRAIFGASGGAIDHTLQDAVKLKAGYAFTPELLASAMLGLWANDSATSNRPLLRDQAGNTVWSGAVSDGVNRFVIPNSAFAPSTREELHRHAGLTLKTKRATGWNGSVVYSNYRILKDIARQALLPDPQAQSGGEGTWTRRDGTGWDTFELQSAYTPVAGDWGDGRHTLIFGLHRNSYRLDSPTTKASDWRNTETTLTQRYQGRTEVLAAYAQDTWRLQENLRLTLGLRQEHFRTSDGEQLLQVASCKPLAGVSCEPNGDGSFNQVLGYDRRSLSGSSPKASLAWEALPDTLLKLSYGRGIRPANVEELYNGTLTSSAVTQSDPNLKPERSDALELSVEQDWELQHLRVSLFHDDVQDSILRQTDISAVPNVTRVSNVDRVRTYGVEIVWQAQDLLIKGLSLDANAAFAHAEVKANARDPQSVGKRWLRIPRVRANLLAAYRPTAQWLASIGMRHSGRAYNDVYNLDIHPNVYGGVSSFTFVDLRGSYKFTPKLELALGLDNALDRRGFQAHPYPGRTVLTELRASY